MAKMSTAPMLLATAWGEQESGEGERCFFCGAPCGQGDRVKLTASFSDWRNVACPDSEFRCVGCALAMKEKWDRPGADKPQKMRNYSWVIYEDQALSFKSSEAPAMLPHLLRPLSTPFSVAVSKSGQRHLLFRTAVNYTREAIDVRMDDEPVTYRPTELLSRVRLAAELIPYVGRTRLFDGIPLAGKVLKMSLEQVVKTGEWNSVVGEPLSRLAATVCPKDGDLSYAEGD